MAAPKRTVTVLNGLISLAPTGWTSRVPRMPTGTSGAPVAITRRATPVWPR